MVMTDPIFDFIFVLCGYDWHLIPTLNVESTCMLQGKRQDKATESVCMDKELTSESLALAVHMHMKAQQPVPVVQLLGPSRAHTCNLHTVSICRALCMCCC